MFARIEIAVRPDLVDSTAQSLLRQIELTDPHLRRQIRWARYLEIYWLDLPVGREELIPALSEIAWDRVLQWVFTGNLMPAAAGKTGGLQDLMEVAPYRPGRFCGVERRFRPGVTDTKGRSFLDALEIVLGKKLDQGRASSGGLFVMEGPGLDEDVLARIARDILCNETLETWTLVPEDGLKKNERFHQERVKYDLPKWQPRGLQVVETFDLSKMSDSDLETLSRKKTFALSLEEMKAIQAYFNDPKVQEKRSLMGMKDSTDVELEVIAQTWSEHCKHKIFNAVVTFEGQTIDSLFKTYVVGTTQNIKKPWLLSVFKDNGGICVFDDDDAFCVKVETHNSASALEPFGGSLTGMLAVNRDILGCGLGAKPIFNTNVMCIAPLDYRETLPDRILHPRRILDGVRRGVQQAGNQSGIPTINGALIFDERYLGKPLVYCGSGGIMPRMSAGEPCEVKKILPGDRIFMVGGRVGKDGIHGATFSSLALSDHSPTSAVQLGDTMIQKRMADFLLEARDLGLYRTLTDNGAGGLSSSVGEMALISGGAQVDVSQAKAKYTGLKPFEIIVSESQERMTVIVPPIQVAGFQSLAERRGVEVSDLGEFNSSGSFDIFNASVQVASLSLNFLHEGVPRLKLSAQWTPPVETPSPILVSTNLEQVLESFKKLGQPVLLGLLSRPNIASKEWIIRQYDHEAQGTSVIKPLHTSASGTARAWSGPNDASVIKPKATSDLGLAVGCGIQPKLSDIDPFLMAQAAVDEAVRNVLCVGAEYGTPESVLALVDNFCWSDPIHDVEKMGALVRACQGLQNAALALGTPLISGKDSMKNEYQGMRRGQSVSISVPPTLLITAVARVTDIKQARTADFKSVGDFIYLIGNNEFGLQGSELQSMLRESAQIHPVSGQLHLGRPNWSLATQLYSWLGGAQGKQQFRLKSLHDLSEGGLMVAVAESLISRGLGASLWISGGRDPWELSFGEGFHSFVGSVAPDDAPSIEAEWDELGIPFQRIGSVENHDRVEVFVRGSAPATSSNGFGDLAFTATITQLRAAWSREGYWE